MSPRSGPRASLAACASPHRPRAMPQSVDPSLHEALAQQIGALSGCVGFIRDAASGAVVLGPADLVPPAARLADIHADDHPACRAAGADGDAYRITYRSGDGAGGWRHLIEQARAVTVDGRRFWVGAVLDVTERIDAERVGARYRAIVECQTEWIVRQRPDRRNTFVNAAYCRYMRLPAEALLAAEYSGLDWMRPQDIRRFAARRAALTPERPSAVSEFPCRHPDGTVHWESWTDTAIFDRAGNVVEYQLIGRDITDRIKAEQALRESEQLHRDIVAAQTDLITRIRPDGRLTFCNEAYCRYMGMSREQLLDPSWDDLSMLAAEDRAVIEAQWAELTPEQPHHTHECPVVLPDGRRRIELWSQRGIFDRWGRLVEVQGVGRDVTEQRAAEQARRESEEAFRRFAEDHPLPLCVLSWGDWRVLFVNPAYLTLFQLTRDELDRIDKATQWADPAARPLYYAWLQRNGRTDKVEVELRRSDGSTFPALLSSRLMRLGGHDVAINSVIDLSEQKAAEAEIRRQREALHQQEKLAALGSLLAGVAHELNNPLSVVLGYASLLRGDARSRKVRDQAERIHAAAERCARIVTTFLSLARQKPPSFGPVDLARTVTAALELTAYGLRTSGVRVTTELPDRLPPVHGDADQLHQVVANLLVNAKQALQEVPPPRELRVAAIVDGTELRLVVEDNGPGMSAEARRRAFEPFFTTKPAGTGTGLGLAVCHGIVTAHGGRIEIGGGPGAGTRIEVSLPIAGAAAPRPVGDRQAPDGGPTGRVLIVEDEPDIAELIAWTLARDGHEVDRVADGQAALARIATGDVDLVVSDLRMPGMDGATLLRTLRAAHPALARSAVLLTGDLLSASADPELRREGVMLLGKPVELEELRRVVRQQLALGVLQ